MANKDDLLRDAMRARMNGGSNTSAPPNDARAAIQNAPHNQHQNATTAPRANVPSGGSDALMSSMRGETSGQPTLTTQKVKGAYDVNMLGNVSPYSVRRQEGPTDYELQKRTVDQGLYQSDPYSNVKWNNTYLDRADTSYYDRAKRAYTDQAEKERASQIEAAQKNQDAALKQAYMQRLQNDRAMQNQLTNAGIRGGASESAMMNLANQYGQARNAANTDYANSVNSINQSVDRNIFDYAMNSDAAAQQYRENMAQMLWNADREDYGNAYNIEREDRMNYVNALNEAEAYNTEAANNKAQSMAAAQDTINANYTQAQNQASQDAWAQNNANAQFNATALNDASINAAQWAREDILNAQQRGDTVFQNKVTEYTGRYERLSDKDLKAKWDEFNKALSTGKKDGKKLTDAQLRNIRAGMAAIGTILGTRRK